MASPLPHFGSRATADEVVADLDLSGKVMLVTGANSGIGFETARTLAGRAATVVLACRTLTKARQTAERISDEHSAARLEPLEVELASQDSIRAAATGLSAPTLDVLVCNAGIYGGPYEETEEGVELTVGVCHLGHFLLTRLLLERLRAAAPSRVVVVSSESHRQPEHLDFDRFPLGADQYSELDAYGQAKLCNLLFALELDRRYRNEGVRANALHPGSMIPTGISRRSRLARIALRVARPLTKTAVQGAATCVYLAARPELSGVGGGYFRDCRPVEPSEEARDPGVAARLWELSERWGGAD